MERLKVIFNVFLFILLHFSRTLRSALLALILPYLRFMGRRTVGAILLVSLEDIYNNNITPRLFNSNNKVLSQKEALATWDAMLCDALVASANWFRNKG